MVAQNRYQAQYAITDLVHGTAPTGVEPFETIQNGQSVQLTLAQIVALIGFAPTIRLPPFNATIAILASDIEVGVSTATGAVTVNLPSALAWSQVFPGGATGLDLLIIDRTGNASTHNMTFGLNGGDTFLQGALPPLTVDFGGLRLRPYGSPVTGCLVKGFG